MDYSTGKDTKLIYSTHTVPYMCGFYLRAAEDSITTVRSSVGRLPNLITPRMLI